jgi:thioredoxin 1
VDVDKNTQAAAAYQVSSVPTLILFKAGKVLWRQSGVASVGSLKELIQKYG